MVRRRMEILKKNQKEMLEKRTLIEMRNSFDGLISRLDTLMKESLSKRIHQYTP